ncbi:MAG: hypothetical protein AAFX44_04935 [Pseudomonadota bacterium]
MLSVFFGSACMLHELPFDEPESIPRFDLPPLEFATPAVEYPDFDASWPEVSLEPPYIASRRYACGLIAPEPKPSGLWVLQTVDSGRYQPIQDIVAAVGGRLAPRNYQFVYVDFRANDK